MAVRELVGKAREQLRAREAGNTRTTGTAPRLEESRRPAVAARYLDVAAIDEHQQFVPDWPAMAPPGYRGQLEPAWQAEQRGRRAAVTSADGLWYHETRLPDGQQVRGAWNLIGNEHLYLGRLDHRGQRVIEFGPATGHLSVWLAYEGADVVSFDAGLDHCIDLIGFGMPTDVIEPEAMRMIGRVQNSWWWLTGQWGVSVPAVYGNIYDLPDDLGMFDTAIFGSILLHLRDPFQALAQAAQRSRRIVITDVVPPMLTDWNSDYSEFNPVHGDQSSWWRLSPGRVRRMVEALGLGVTDTYRHAQYIRPQHDVDAAFTAVDCFTIVAEKPR